MAGVTSEPLEARRAKIKEKLCPRTSCCPVVRPAGPGLAGLHTYMNQLLQMDH